LSHSAGLKKAEMNVLLTSSSVIFRSYLLLNSEKLFSNLGDEGKYFDNFKNILVFKSKKFYLKK